MQAVLIAMTIFGCDDSLSQCNYVATLDKHWATVELCNAESEKQLQTYTHVNAPTVIAVCQAPQTAAAPEKPKPTEPVVAAALPAPGTPEPDGIRGFAARTASQVRNMLPSGEGLRAALVKPVHFVSDSYSWVVRRLD